MSLLLTNQLVWWQMVARLEDVAHGSSMMRNKRERKKRYEESRLQFVSLEDKTAVSYEGMEGAL